MKVTLFALNTTYSHSNIAIRYLASVLRNNNIEPVLCEYNLKDKHETVLHNLYVRDSMIYAFSVYIWNRTEMLHYARLLKQIKPDCKIIMGGPEIGYENESFFIENPYIDTIISGEGESSIINVCTDIENYKHKIVHSKPSDDFLNSGILYDKFKTKSPIIYYESSRGCPHGCSYCLSSATKGVRIKSLEKTIADIKEIEKLPYAKIVKFVDRTFNCDMKRAKELWKELSKQEYTKTYHFEICADTIDNEAIDIISHIPDGRIQFEAGIQSTNNKTLEAINRYTNTKKALHNLKKIKELNNVHIHADLIVGLPHEDYESFKRSFNETIGCCDKLQVGFLKLLKGSILKTQTENHGYIFDLQPPYRILENKYISYSEIHKLTEISNVIDRFYSSDKFKFSMNYIISNSKSPFDFFEKFTEYLNITPDKLSQYDCIISLFEFCSKYYDDTKILEYITLDTLIGENKTPPGIMDEHYVISEDENNNKIYSFPSMPKIYYKIDRTKHTYKKYCRN